MSNKKETPPWYEGSFASNSYRSLFKWGAIDTYKHPSDDLVTLLKERLKVSDDDFGQPSTLGLDIVPDAQPCGLTNEQIHMFEDIVGAENISSDTYSRLRASYGQAAIDNLRLRKGIIENIPDLVLHPRDKEDISKIISFCHHEKIPVYIVSGRTSVTRGCEAVQGGVALDITTHMNRVISFNEKNHTVTVQPGIFGPALEKILNNAQQEFHAERAYTCGHFPQSFEFSTVGGWVLTRGAGQNSTYYGKIEDLVVSQEYITPVDPLITQGYPRQATGPDINQIMIGSEGVFGVLVEVTLKVFFHTPLNRYNFSHIFKNWPDAQEAARRIMQAEAGFPSVFRISDPEETEIAMHLYGIAGTPAEKLLSTLGFKTGEMCLMLGYADGDKSFSKNLSRKIKRTTKSFNALNLSLFGVTQHWEHSRFSDPYMRDSLADFGILIDTLECSVTWDNLNAVHSCVRETIKNRPDTICMTHLSHAYPQGANLYFIFITKSRDVHDYLKLQYSILDAIVESGASVSHHHGLGKQLAPWHYRQVGDSHINLLRRIKDHFDPHHIMNPGGTLGLDMTPEQTSGKWGISEIDPDERSDVSGS